jgi:hypothetical protein
MTVKQVRNDALVELLRPDFQARYEPNFAWKSACASFLALTGLRGFWPMSSFNENGNAYDLSGQGRILTYNGNPTYNYSSLVPYIDLDGTGDYLSRLDEAGLDILGTETYVAAAVRGLTIGGWFWFDNATEAGQTVLMTKGAGGGANTSYWLARNAGGTPRFNVGDGAALQGPSSTQGTGAAVWTFLVGRFIPSTEVALFQDNIEYTDLVGIPAALINTATDIEIGSYNAGAGLFHDGRASLCFLCAVALSDSIISALFHQTRAMFNV